MDNNFRSPILVEPSIGIGAGNSVIRTPLGNVQSLSNNNSAAPLPPLPPNPMQCSNSNYGTPGGIYGTHYNAPYSFGNYGNIGGYGNYGGYGSGMYGGYSGGYSGGYNSFGNNFGYSNPYDPEFRFIQLAEQSSRPAFESIQSLVSAVANISAMLDSTFFAITSSFRAILGVAANFGQLRGVFSQFWQTFAIFRSISWLYKKLLYWLKISNIDPSSEVFKEAFEAARAQATGNGETFDIPSQSKKKSPWPIVIFLSFIFTAPYLVMKLLGNLTSTALEETKDPRRWVNAIKSSALYDFNARNVSELSIKRGQDILIAPKEIQNTQKLLNTGWVLATIDNINTGLVPLAYVQRLDKLKPINNVKESSDDSHTRIFPKMSISNLEAQISAAENSKKNVDNLNEKCTDNDEFIGPNELETMVLKQDKNEIKNKDSVEISNNIATENLKMPQSDPIKTE